MENAVSAVSPTTSRSKTVVLTQQPQTGSSATSLLFYEAPSLWLSSTTSTTAATASSSTATVAAAAATTTTSKNNKPPPSQQDIKLLQTAFANIYGITPDYAAAQEQLSSVIQIWTKLEQPDDELAALYRVRGDVYTATGQAAEAIADYNQAIMLLRNDDTNAAADPAELPAALLGRARAIKSQSSSSSSPPAAASDTKTSLQQAAADYKEYLILSSREEWDTTDELLQDGATRNPYAASEWGTVLRKLGDAEQAATAHQLAAVAFSDIGDKARAVVSQLDAGIDLAAASSSNNSKKNNAEEAIRLLQQAIPKTKGVESRDVQLLQRTVAKEGEARMALAALLWSEGQRSAAESALGEACLRLDQLQASAASDNKQTAKVAETDKTYSRLLFSMDDDSPALDLTCSKFKNSEFLTERLGWPEALQKKVIKLEKLQP